MPQPFDPKGRHLEPKTFARKLAEHLSASAPSPRRRVRARAPRQPRTGRPWLANAFSGITILAMCVGAGLAVAALAGWVAGLIPGSNGSPTAPVVFPVQVSGSTIPSDPTTFPFAVPGISTTTMPGSANHTGTPGGPPVSGATSSTSPGSSVPATSTTSAPGPTTPATTTTTTTVPEPSTTTTLPEASTTTTLCWPPGRCP
jgi:hypothetical protein